MPFLNDFILNTSLKNTRQAQDRLLLMHEAPHLVERVAIDPDGTVTCRFMDGPTVPIGTLKPKYRSIFSKKLHVQTWKITGGEELPTFGPNGQRMRYFGVNLRLLIVEPTMSRTGEAATVHDAAPVELVLAD